MASGVQSEVGHPGVPRHLNGMLLDLAGVGNATQVHQRHGLEQEVEHEGIDGPDFSGYCRRSLRGLQTRRPPAVGEVHQGQGSQGVRALVGGCSPAYSRARRIDCEATDGSPV